jgi:glycosyltransferase involved in cell wall biosynthesis
MATAAPSLTAIVMAYNEAPTLTSVVEEIESALIEHRISYEVLIVDDGSSDGTAEVADQLAQKSDMVQVIHHEHNQGLGGVYRTGFRAARGDYLTFFPADAQFPASIMLQFWRVAPGHDLVLGYIEQRRSPFAALLSSLERQLYGYLFGPLPRFQGVLMLRRQLLQEMQLASSGRGWAVLMEFIIRSAQGGYRVVSVPTAFRPRAQGRSKVNNVRTIYSNLMEALVLRRHLRTRAAPTLSSPAV